MSAAVDPVGIAEIMGRLDVTRAAVEKWRTRDLGFPEPTWTIGGRPAWEWGDIQEWATATGRT